MPEDYIMRLIEQATQMLARIIAEQKTNGSDGATREIERKCLAVTGLSLDIIKRSSPERLIDLLRQGGNFYTRAVLLAELLIKFSEISEEKGRQAEAICSQLQSFCLLLESIDALPKDDQLLYFSKLKFLVQKLQIVSQDPYIQEKIGKYDMQYSQFKGLE